MDIMQIGPITIRWTKDIKAEQEKSDKAKAISVKLLDTLLAKIVRYQAALERWGVSEGVMKGKDKEGK